MEKQVSDLGIPMDLVHWVWDDRDEQKEASPEKTETVANEVRNQKEQPIEVSKLFSNLRNLRNQDYLRSFIQANLISRIEPIVSSHTYHDDEKRDETTEESKFFEAKGIFLFPVHKIPGKPGTPFPSYSESIEAYLLEDGTLAYKKTRHNSLCNDSGYGNSVVSNTATSKLEPMTEEEIVDHSAEIIKAIYGKIRIFKLFGASTPVLNRKDAKILRNHELVYLLIAKARLYQFLGESWTLDSEIYHLRDEIEERLGEHDFSLRMTS